MRFLKGAADLIGVILIIAIAMSAAVFLGFFFTDFTKDQTETIDGKSGYVDCNFANFVFKKENVLISKADSGYANITMRNSGSVDLYNFSVFVQKSGGLAELNVTTASQKTKDSPLLEGQVVRIETIGNTTGATSIRIIPGNCPLAHREISI